MKKRNGIIFGIVLVLALILCHFEQIEAKQKQVEKPLKQEWAKKTEEFSYETLTIEKGKTYTLKEMLKPFWDFYDLDEKLYKGSKIMISGKGLLIKKKPISGKKALVKKKTIRADETGNYWLKVKAKDSFHLFRVKAVEKYFNVMESEVAKITITEYRMGDVIRIEITDPYQIRQIVSKLVKSRYVFTCPVLGSRVHSGDYKLGLYSADGRCIEGVTMLPNGIEDYYWVRISEDPSSAQECYDYIYKLYKDIMFQIPKRSWE